MLKHTRTLAQACPCVTELTLCVNVKSKEVEAQRCDAYISKMSIEWLGGAVEGIVVLFFFSQVVMRVSSIRIVSGRPSYEAASNWLLVPGPCPSFLSPPLHPVSIWSACCYCSSLSGSAHPPSARPSIHLHRYKIAVIYIDFLL